MCPEEILALAFLLWPIQRQYGADNRGAAGTIVWSRRLDCHELHHKIPIISWTHTLEIELDFLCRFTPFERHSSFLRKNRLTDVNHTITIYDPWVPFTITWVLFRILGGGCADPPFRDDRLIQGRKGRRPPNKKRQQIIVVKIVVRIIAVRAELAFDADVANEAEERLRLVELDLIRQEELRLW